ncbi:MAG TPA: hypothetical protein PKN27_03460 [Propionibacteriaceae bacterium]|nr:hypothetical protein [Propionibacteriaceae bacterium]
MNKLVRPMRAALVTLIGVLTLIASLLVAAPQAEASYCGLHWGSLPKSGGTTMTSAQITNVRAGRHTCYDRLVIDLNGKVKGYDVRYATVYGNASGIRIPLLGAGDLRITVQAPAYNLAGKPTYVPVSRKNMINVTGYKTFRQVAWADSFEGNTIIGLGVRARLPFRVFVLAGPGTGSRLVIDVAHYW